MCVIISKPKERALSKDQLQKCWDRNKDGAGYVAFLDGELFHETGLMDFNSYYHSVERFLGKDATLFTHMRISSRGGVSQGLTHPFEVTLKSNKKAFLFHNGTASCIDTLPAGWSDTKLVADMLKGLSFHEATFILANLNEHKHGRFILVTEDKEFFVIGDEESKDVDGIWFSNLRHELFVKTTTYQTPNPAYCPQPAKTTPPKFSSSNGPVPFEPVSYKGLDAEDFFITTRKGEKTSLPSKGELIEIIAGNYMDSNDNEIDAAVSIIQDAYSLDNVPYRHLFTIARAAQAGVTNTPIEDFFESFS